jgi:hypothetical protein
MVPEVPNFDEITSHRRICLCLEDPKTKKPRGTKMALELS